MKPGQAVEVSYNRKRGVVLATKGDTVIVKVGDKTFYLKTTEVRAV